MKKTKLFLLITKGNFGGAQRYVYDLATNLPKEKYDITVILGEGILLQEKLKERNIRVIQLPELRRNVGIFSEIKVFIRLLQIFYKEKPNIIHLNSSKIGGLGALAGRLTRIPKIIFTGHGWAFNEDRSWLTKKIILFLHWITILLSSKVIAVSEKTKLDIIHLPFIKKKIVIVYNGIIKEDILDKENAQQKLSNSSAILKNIDHSNLFWIGSVAELHKNKGLDIAIESMSEIIKNNPQVIYLIIGEGEERENLKNQIKKLELENSVFLIGLIPEAKKYLKAFDLFILPSRTEAFPYVLLEAGLAELPIIASNVGGIPEVIENKKNGILIKPENKEGLTEEISKLIKDKTNLSKYGNQLEVKIKNDFSLTKMIKETENLYRSI